jgi:hypothetical protein
VPALNRLVLALGRCKTSVDCTYVSAPLKHYCGLYLNMADFGLFCDGSATCTGPTVTCGGDGECPLYDMYCCGSPGGLTCQSSTCPVSPHYGPYYCNEKSDCPPGDVCCLDRGPSGMQSQCRPSSCNGGLELCNPNVLPSECSSGTCMMLDPSVDFSHCM